MQSEKSGWNGVDIYGEEAGIPPVIHMGDFQIWTRETYPRSGEWCYSFFGLLLIEVQLSLSLRELHAVSVSYVYVTVLCIYSCFHFQRGTRT